MGRVQVPGTVCTWAPPLLHSDHSSMQHTLLFKCSAQAGPLLPPNPPTPTHTPPLFTPSMQSNKAVPTGIDGVFTSMYRGVTKHKLTGRFEAHFWDASFKREPTVSCFGRSCRYGCLAADLGPKHLVWCGRWRRSPAPHHNPLDPLPPSHLDRSFFVASMCTKA
jgi:hypothetical protein